MSRWLIAFSVAFAVCVGVPGTVDAALTVDGDLYDWGITLDTTDGHWHTLYDGYAAGYQGTTDPVDPVQGVKEVEGEPDIFYVMEDTNDHNNDYRVGPFYGGQNFDAQFLAVSLSDSILSIAISSGQRPDNGYSRYAPGDIMIKMEDGTLYGIEVGGGKGYSSPPPDPTTPPTTFPTGYSNVGGDLAGWTYDLWTSGYTQTPHLATNPDQAVGSLWMNTDNDWRKGLPTDSNGNFTGIFTQINGGTQVDGISPVAVNFDKDHADTDLWEHAWIEAQIDTSLLGKPDDIAFIRWAPSCANDELALTVTLPPAPPIPEPASVVVWGLLSLTVGAYTWRRKRMAKVA